MRGVGAHIQPDHGTFRLLLEPLLESARHGLTLIAAGARIQSHVEIGLGQVVDHERLAGGRGGALEQSIQRHHGALAALAIDDQRQIAPEARPKARQVVGRGVIGVVHVKLRHPHDHAIGSGHRSQVADDALLRGHHLRALDQLDAFDVGRRQRQRCATDQRKNEEKGDTLEIDHVLIIFARPWTFRPTARDRIG